MSIRFDSLQTEAEARNIVVERVGGSHPYEVYHDNQHGHVCLCENLNEVEQAIDEVSQYA